jgi:hypothetical protein
MSRTRFTVALVGQGVDDGTIDVADLAPSLLAIGKLFDAANTSLNGDQVKVSVRVRATAPGSFEINLEAIQSLVSQVKDFLAGDTVTAIVNLKELLLVGVVGGGWCVVRLIRKLRGRPPSRIRNLKDGTVEITADGETFVVPLKLLRLYQDMAVRKAVQDAIVKPLEKPELERIEFKEEGRVVEAVDKGERDFFVAPTLPEETLVDDRRRAAFSIISLAFKEDNKWRLHDGNTQISASIADKEFLKRVDSNQVAFAKGDILVCEVRVTQTRTADGLRADYVVERVLEHRAAARQLAFPLETDEPPSPAAPPASAAKDDDKPPG